MSCEPASQRVPGVSRGIERFLLAMGRHLVLMKRSPLVVTLLLLVSSQAQAQAQAPAIAPAISGSFSWIVGLALLGLLPFAFMALTAFVKISTVLHIARSALGVPAVPSNAVVLVLASALTLLAMAPVVERVSERVTPLLQRGEPSAAVLTDLAVAVKEPLRQFLTDNAAEEQTARFTRLARQRSQPGSVNERDFIVAIPAFMVTELVEAFSLGFALFLPFLVLDLLVANILIALGMLMTNPTQVSLPFKLLLFVAADGWGLLAEALVSGYR